MVSQENRVLLEQLSKRGIGQDTLRQLTGLAEGGMSISPLLDNPFEEHKNQGIQLPQEVADKISYNAWTGLSYAIWKDYIPNQKWLMSEKEGQDIGVPETVRMMVEINPTNSRGVYYVIQCRVKLHEIKDFERLLVIGYLLRTDFVTKNLPPIPDEHGSNQLEGELRRYWARKNRIVQPTTVELSHEVIDDYCETYCLDGISERFVRILNL